MHNIVGLVAAAGRGSRAGLPYPKTLFTIQGRPILIRILDLLEPYDTKPTVIVSPGGQRLIRDCLEDFSKEAFLVIQEMASGMGNAVLQFERSPSFEEAEHVILIWGDIPFIQPMTLHTMVQVHLDKKNDFTFVTRWVDRSYTVVERDANGSVQSVLETREMTDGEQQPGERDVGLFIFRKDPVVSALKERLPGMFGTTTKEHGFLYVIAHLAKRGLRVDALPIAVEHDLISLNHLNDVAPYL